MKPHVLIVLTLCLAWSAVGVRAQEDAKARTDEEDARVLSAAARQDAVTTLLAAGQQFRDAGEKVKAARAWNRAGRFQLQLNRADQALLTYQDAVKVLGRKPDPEMRIDSLNGIASAYKQMSKFAEAREVLRRTIFLSEQNSYTEGSAEAHLIQPDCLSNKAHGLRSAQESLRLWKSINHKLGTARAYLVVGEYQIIQNTVVDSIESYETALKLWRELNVPYQVAQALINLGYNEYRKGAWQASFPFYIQAQNLIDAEAEPYMMGQIASGFAEALLESGMPELGLAKYRESLNYFLLTKSPSDKLGIEWGIGRAHYMSGNYSEALAMLSTTRAEAESLEVFMIAGLSDDFLGRTYFELKDYTAALQHYQAALDRFVRFGNPMEAARILALIGRVYQQQGDFKRAKVLYERALTAFRKLSDRLNESATLYMLGTLELQQNEIESAEEHLLQSIKITEEMRRVSTSVDLTAAFSARIHERYEKYIDCMMRKHKASGSESLAIEAFQTSELARARSLSESLHATGANLFPDIDPVLAQREKRAREFLQISENSRIALLSQPYTRAGLEAWEERHQQLKAEHEKIVAEIRALKPDYEQVIQPKTWDLKKIQEQVVADDQTTLLEFSIGSEKSYLWAITRAGLKSYELPGEAQIASVAERVRKLLVTAPLSNTELELSNAVQDLARTILWPASEQLNSRRIIVVPDGILNYIPFQILPLPGSNEPLVANKEIVNAPSASILGELQQEAARRRPAASLLAAFGDPVFAPDDAQPNDANVNEQTIARARLHSALRDVDSNRNALNSRALSPLFYAKRELDGLREVAGESALIVTEDAATRDEFLKTDLTQFEILHLVTHGFFFPKYPDESGFVLSTINREKKPVRGFVGLREIYELRAPVLLVVLSACQTALGKDVRGEGLVGLTRSFLYAGASGVVASLWEVDDAATSELMKTFYSNMLQHGMKPGEALRAAQNTIRQQPEWRSPYYWAAFTLQGESRQIIKPRSEIGTSRLKIPAAVAVLLILAGVAALRYRRQRRAGTSHPS